MLCCVYLTYFDARVQFVCLVHVCTIAVHLTREFAGVVKGGMRGLFFLSVCVSMDTLSYFGNDG